MKILNISEGNVNYVSESNPKSENLIMSVTRLVVGGAIAVTAMIVAGMWGVLAVGGLMFFGISIKAVEGIR